MNVFKFIIAILLSGVYIIWRNWQDPYHLTVAVPVACILLIIFGLMARQSAAVVEEEGGEEEEEPGPGRIIGPVFVAILMATAIGGAMTGAIHIADKTRLSTVFFDTDRKAFDANIAMLTDGTPDWVKVEKLATDRLDGKISPQWRKDLEALVFEAIIGQGDQAEDANEKVAQYDRAATWAEEHDIRPDEAESKSMLNQPTMTPTFTMTPTTTATPTMTQTPTMIPTVTLTATLTATPSATPTQPIPTLPEGYNDCQGAVLVEQMDLVKNEMLRLYMCSEPGLYKVEWLLAANEYRDSMQYSSLVREGAITGATFMPGGRVPFTVTVKNGRMEVKSK